jgi:hypothetical protein
MSSNGDLVADERADANALTVDGAMLDDFLARFEAPVNER